MGYRRRLVFAASVLVLAGCGGAPPTPPTPEVKPSLATEASKPASPPASPAYRVAAPGAVGGRKRDAENDYGTRDLAYAVRSTVEEVIKEAPAYAVYGTRKDGNLMMFAAALVKQPTRLRVGAILRGLAENLDIAAANPDSHGEGRTCGDATIEGEPAALCTWRDERSIGIALFPGQRPAAVRYDFASLQGQAFIAYSTG